MQKLTSAGQNLVNQLAQQHGFSADATAHMLIAVVNGNGSMAQFNHSEFGGGGQWMQGGMIMLGDMFNNHLKGRVDSLCSAISQQLSQQPNLLQSGSFQSQSQQSGSDNQRQQSGQSGSQNPFFVDQNQNWWPSDLGQPSATGSQNQMSYAYFPNQRRVAIKTGTQIWVYDTLDHQIGGFGQQQGGNSGITLSSQFGTVNLQSLPLVTRDGQPVAPLPTPAMGTNAGNADQESDIFQKIERLAALRDKGVLGNQEFENKKAELLSRL